MINLEEKDAPKCPSDLLLELQEDLHDILMRVGFISEVICKERCGDACDSED